MVIDFFVFSSSIYSSSSGHRAPMYLCFGWKTLQAGALIKCGSQYFEHGADSRNSSTTCDIAKSI